MNIGFACIAIGVPGAGLRTCVKKNATDENLLAIIQANLAALDRIIEYNIKNEIKLFRISSDLIPFGSSEINQLEWWNLFTEQFHLIGKKIVESGMRVSMHPGQYTVINSPKDEVVNRAVEDLFYHARVLDALGVDSTHKIILHIGGVYGDKTTAIARFIENYKMLPEEVKERLVIENDDKSYHIADVLQIGTTLKIPVVYDTLHNQVNPYDREKTDCDWIELCRKTWTKKDGRPKIHYSRQHPGKQKGSHSDSIKIREFLQFKDSLNGIEPDVMLEVKDKNLSAIKCNNAIRRNSSIKNLETEWGHYKYLVLEKSQQSYAKIRVLLKQKENYPVEEFYQLIEDALSLPDNQGNACNALLHIWGYFKNQASKIEKERFRKLQDTFEVTGSSGVSAKRFLWRLAERYQEEYLLQSYYFLSYGLK